MCGQDGLRNVFVWTSGSAVKTRKYAHEESYDVIAISQRPPGRAGGKLAVSASSRAAEVEGGVRSGNNSAQKEMERWSFETWKGQQRTG